MKLKGQCHCGQLTFELTLAEMPAMIQARACDCTFCTRQGCAWTSLPNSEVLIYENPDQVSRYSFETETADFHICRNCGCVPLVTSLIGDQEYAVINVKMLSNYDLVKIQISPVQLTAETEAERLRRRQRNWINRVRYADIKPKLSQQLKSAT